MAAKKKDEPGPEPAPAAMVDRTEPTEEQPTGARSGMPGGFQRSSEIPTSEAIKILIYGDNGTGKTTIGCTAPDPFFIVTELKALRRIKAMGKTLKIEIPVKVVESLKDMNVALDTLDRKPKRCSVVLDSASDLYNVLIAEFCSGKASVPRKDDWQLIQAQMENILRRLSNNRHDAIVLCAHREVSTEDGIRVAPAFRGERLPTQIGKLFQAVGYTFKKKTADGRMRYLVAFEPDGLITAKRDDGLRPIEVPNVALWRKAISEAYAAGQHAYDFEYELGEGVVPEPGTEKKDEEF